MEAVHIIGAGGHGKVVAATLQAVGRHIAGFWDDDASKTGTFILGIPVRGTLQALLEQRPAQGVVAVGDNRMRQQLVERIGGALSWTSVVHPNADVHPSARIGEGSVVLSGAIIQPDAALGAHTIINTGATVDHDCRLGDYVHLAPGCHLSGDVVVREGGFLGVGAVVLPGGEVGAWATVGAGAVVLKAVAPGIVAVGVPARPLKKPSIPSK